MKLIEKYLEINIYNGTSAVISIKNYNGYRHSTSRCCYSFRKLLGLSADKNHNDLDI